MGYEGEQAWPGWPLLRPCGRSPDEPRAQRRAGRRSRRAGVWAGVGGPGHRGGCRPGPGAADRTAPVAKGGPSVWHQCWSRPPTGQGQGRGTSGSDTWAWRRSPRRTSLTWVCTGPPSRLCTTALAIRVRWPMFPRLMPPAALKERVASGLPPALLRGASSRPGLGSAASSPRAPLPCEAVSWPRLQAAYFWSTCSAPASLHSLPTSEVGICRSHSAQTTRPTPGWGCEC